MFDRLRHQRIAHVLSALDADVLRAHGCLFGGGTCIALRCGEYRESVDIDFLVSDAAGYRGLRELLTGPAGLVPITRSGALPLVMLREVRADQYGIRTQVQMDGQAYGAAVVRDLSKALARLQSREGWLERCMKAMAMDMPKAVLWQKIRSLRRLGEPEALI